MADEVIMRLIDVWLAVPFIMIVLVLVVAIGQSFPLLVAVLGASTWAGFTRQVRGLTLSLPSGRLRGVGEGRGRFGYEDHDAPYSAAHDFDNPGPWIASGRIFDTRGGDPLIPGSRRPSPTPSWGSIVADGRSYLATAWWGFVIPGIAIFLVVMAFNFAGDWIRDRLDPRLRQV